MHAGGYDAQRVFAARVHLSINALTSQNGKATNGSGLTSTSNVTLTNVGFLTNTASTQGGDGQRRPVLQHRQRPGRRVGGGRRPTRRDAAAPAWCCVRSR